LNIGINQNGQELRGDLDSLLTSLENLSQKSDLNNPGSDDCSDTLVDCKSVRFPNIVLSRSTITNFVTNSKKSDCDRTSFLGYNGFDTVTQNDSSLNLFLLTQANLPNSTSLTIENEEQRAGFYIDQCSYLIKGKSYFLLKILHIKNLTFSNNTSSSLQS